MADAEVVVVGAGIAGLAAAVHLARAGRSVQVLESSDGVGGRVRSDQVDGFTLDRGFQVFNTAYPELARLLDRPSLELRPFTPGALVYRHGRLHRVSDPRRRPLDSLASVRAPVGSLTGKLALARLAVAAATEPVARLLAAPETTSEQLLRDSHVGEELLETVLRPFLSGVFLERELTTSSRFLRLVLRAFVRGTVAVPAAGMEAIPRQLARQLPVGSLALGTPLESLEQVADAEAVIVATDPATAHRLLPELGPAPAMTSTSTVYYDCDSPPLTDPVLCLDGERLRLLTSAVVLTAAAPTYAPPGRHLVSASVLGTEPEEPLVRAQLRDWFGGQVDGWRHLTTVRIPAATPVQPPPLGSLRRPVSVRDRVFVAGDSRDTSSTQGAAVSGRRAACAVLARLS